MEKFMIFAAILGMLNTYVVARLFSYAPFETSHKIYAVAIILLLTAIEMAPFIVSRISIDPGDANPVLQKSLYVFYFVSYAVMGAFFCSLFFMVVGDIVGLAGRYLAPENYWPQIKSSIYWGVIFATLFSTAVGILYAAQYPRLVEVAVPIKGLPDAFDGYKIVQISDLHVGPLIRKKYVEHMVGTVNQTDADLIVFTGDMADGSVKELRNHIWPLTNLKSKDGNYFILGNHEYYWELDRWMALYDSMGFRTLLNSHDVISRGDAKLAIAGVTDYGTRRVQTPLSTDVNKAAAGIPKDAAKILLAHQPTDYKKAAAAGFDLQLSGHTHGGQFFPWNIGLHLYHRYLYGLGQYEDMWVFVTRGAGYWGPPLRGFTPSEVVLLTLKKG